MHLLTLVSFLLVSSFSLAANYYGGRRPAGPSPAGPSPAGPSPGVDPWSLIVSGSKHPWPLDLSGPDNNIPVGPTRSTLTCEFGRQLNQQGSCRSLYMSNKAADCPPNFSCQSAFGLCCLVNNPCSEGRPLLSNGEAESCDTQICPTGYTCSRGDQYAVCCPEVTNTDQYPRTTSGQYPTHPQPCPSAACPYTNIPPNCRRERVITYNGIRCRCARNACSNGDRLR